MVEHCVTYKPKNLSKTWHLRYEIQNITAPHEPKVMTLHNGKLLWNSWNVRRSWLRSHTLRTNQNNWIFFKHVVIMLCRLPSKSVLRLQVAYVPTLNVVVFPNKPQWETPHPVYVIKHAFIRNWNAISLVTSRLNQTTQHNSTHKP